MAMPFYVYLGCAYGAPFGMFAFLFVIITIVNRRANAFIIKHVLGIKLRKSTDDEKNHNSRKINSASVSNKITSVVVAPRIDSNGSSNNGSDTWSLDDNVETFLYIEQDEETVEPKALPWIVRLFCDLFSSGVLAVLLEIIYVKCILAYQKLLVGDPCPDFEVDCFGAYNGSRYSGPFQCRPGQNANFPVISQSVSCYGWRYQDMSTDDVLNAIGVSGGLLGLISCIVPFVYHVSYFKKHRWYLGIPCVRLPIIPISSFALFVWWIYPAVVTVLTIITFALLTVMASGGWIWALVASCQSGGRCKSGCCCRCCCWTKCCSKNSLLV